MSKVRSVGRPAALVLGGAFVTIALIGLGLAGTWRERTDADRIRLDPENAALVAQGREVYRDACASCHGAALQGQPDWQRRNADGRLPAPPHDASGHTWHHPDALLFALTKQGPAALIEDRTYVSDMPGFADTLSDRDIVAVLSYIKSTWPPEVRARHDAINARAAGG